MSEKIPVKNVDPESKVRYRMLYEDSGKVYTRNIVGFYRKIRGYTGLPLIWGFLLLPWLTIDGRPAVLFDLPERKFHVLWMTFWPQDGMLLAWLLIIAAFSLFTVTVLLGRVWCGFTCPQTVWTLMFIQAEYLIEGDRNARIKLDKQPWTFNKLLRKGGKHLVWILIALLTGLTFVGYFAPIRELILGFVPAVNDYGMVTFAVHPVAAFWTLFFTAATYVNAGWMREQVCKYMCPYARFQAVMYDKDTLAVHYDRGRGEQRGPRKIGEDYKAIGLGDCIDCSWCVQVCPADIDIRDGLQYECINCGLCVDACNQVMDKMNYPRGLIRFTSEDELETGSTKFVRPRLFGYSAVVLVMIVAFVYTVGTREPVSVDVIRDRGARLYRISDDQVQNVYTIKINNMDRAPHSYDIAVRGDGNFEIRGYRPLQLVEGEVFTLPVRVSVPREDLKSSKSTIYVTVTATDDASITATEDASFIGPHRD